jgi:hypothetical protein
MAGTCDSERLGSTRRRVHHRARFHRSSDPSTTSRSSTTKSARTKHSGWTRRCAHPRPWTRCRESATSGLLAHRLSRISVVVGGGGARNTRRKGWRICSFTGSEELAMGLSAGDLDRGRPWPWSRADGSELFLPLNAFWILVRLASRDRAFDGGGGEVSENPLN